VTGIINAYWNVDWQPALSTALKDKAKNSERYEKKVTKRN